MSILLALFLGIVQGLAEFLPISSSGHLILFQHLFRLPEDMLLFDIILHVATLVAVVIVFHKKIWQLIRHPLNKTNLYLIITTIITCSLVLVFKDAIDKTFNYRILPITFMLTAVILYSTTFARGGRGGVSHPTTAITAGLAQFVAVIPGLSRSGTTISALLHTGVERKAAAEYSFLMSIPIILASFLYEVVGIKGHAGLATGPTVIAFIAALISGVFAIKFMLRVIQNVKLHWFSVYLVALSIVCLILF